MRGRKTQMILRLDEATREQLLQRKRLRIADSGDLAGLSERLMAFVAKWNEQVHPFNWSIRSMVKVMAEYAGRHAA